MKYADRSVSSIMIHPYVQAVTLFPVVSSPAGMDDYLKSAICDRRGAVFLLVIPSLANHHPSLWHLWLPPLAEPARLKNSCKMLRRNSRITKVVQNPSDAITSVPLDRFQGGDNLIICNNYFKTERECRYSDVFNADDSLMPLHCATISFRICLKLFMHCKF